MIQLENMRVVRLTECLANKSVKFVEGTMCLTVKIDLNVELLFSCG